MTTSQLAEENWNRMLEYVVTYTHILRSGLCVCDSASKWESRQNIRMKEKFAFSSLDYVYHTIIQQYNVGL